MEDFPQFSQSLRGESKIETSPCLNKNCRDSNRFLGNLKTGYEVVGAVFACIPPFFKQGHRDELSLTESIVPDRCAA
jgi:hypothetical protein